MWETIWQHIEVRNRGVELRVGDGIADSNPCIPHMSDKVSKNMQDKANEVRNTKKQAEKTEIRKRKTRES